MSNYLDKPSILGGWRLPAGIVGALVFAAVACTPRQTTSQDIAREIAGDADTAPLVAAFQAHYPREYEAMLARLAAVRNDRGEGAAAREAAQQMRAFMLTKVSAMAQAPATDLREIGNAITTTITELQRRDVNLCAQFVTRGFTPGQQIPDGPKQALVRVAALQLQAARHAEDGQRVNRTALSEADGEVWFRRISTIAPDLAPMINDGSIERATITRQCQAGLAIYQAATQLPEETAANVVAHLLRESARASRP